MQKIALVTDSSCDLGEKTRRDNNIEMLPFRIIYKDKEFLDQVNITQDELYKSLSEEIPTTSLPDLEYTENLFRRLKEEGYTDVIVVTVSSTTVGALKKGEIMLSKMKKSVVICMNSLISVIIFCMIIMLLCSCVSAARTTWKQAKKTYHSMVEYYTRDVENNLSNISDYLLRISETADYYGMTNCEEDKESMNNLSRQRLYNQLNEDILVYSSADYFFIFQDK